MKYNRHGGNDLDASEICPGTMTFGERNSEAQAYQQLDYAVSPGINFFDAAEMYAVPPRAEMQARTQNYVGSRQKDQQRDELKEDIDIVDAELSESVLVEFGAIHRRYPKPAL